MSPCQETGIFAQIHKVFFLLVAMLWRRPRPRRLAFLPAVAWSFADEAAGPCGDFCLVGLVPFAAEIEFWVEVDFEAA